MNSQEIMELDHEHAANTYARFPIALDHGCGALLYDADGKEYIDLGCGIGVSAFGSCDPEWVAAVSAQAAKLQHASNLYYTEPSARLAAMLCERTGMSRVFFSNSGAEANECAIKAARKYAEVHHGRDTFTIITLKNSFHGRTITTLSATGQDVFHKDFRPMTPGFVYADADDIESVKFLADSVKCAAVMIEVVQGEGGVCALEAEFVQAVEKLCRERDMVFIVDEVQSGNGRTGEFYAYMNYGVHPDVVTTAKGIAGGLPMGATILGERVADLFTPGSNGSTFGGNPVAAAGALSILSRIDDDLLVGVRERGDLIRAKLAGVPGVVRVTGMGLMVGVEVECNAAALLARLQAKGVLALTAKTKLRLLPPLNIDMALLSTAIDRIIEAISEEMA